MTFAALFVSKKRDRFPIRDKKTHAKKYKNAEPKRLCIYFTAFFLCNLMRGE